MRTFLLLFSLFLLFSCQSTKTPSLSTTDQLIRTLNRQFSNAHPPPPHLEFIALSDLDITKPELAELQTKHNDSFNDIRDSIEPYIVVEFMEGKGLKTLREILEHKDLTAEKLKKNDPELDFDLITSDDNKLFHLKREQALSGSAVIYHSVLYYRTEDGNSVSYFSDLNSEDNNNPLKNNGFDTIFTIQEGGRTFYLLQGLTVGCNTCLSEYFMLVEFVNGQLELRFNYSLSGRTGSISKFEYEKDKNILKINHTTDDLLTTCECLEDKTASNEQQCSCTYKFNGNTFVLVE